ncbi:MAG: hypothetical protein M1133_04755 [Armatimonadetes bacterium]|nr:hypothetical protein [Armatimonadota bacterium]
MTGRERLLNIFDRRAADRIAVAPFIYENFVKEFHHDHSVDLIAGTIDVCEHFGFDIIHRNCTPAYDHIGDSSDNWRVEKETETSGRDECVRTVVHTPEGNLTEVYRLVWISEYDAEATSTEYLVKSEDDFQLLAQYQPPVSKLDASLIVRTREALGERGITAPWVQGAFNFVCVHYRSLDQLVMDALENPEFYHSMMEYFLASNMSIIQQYIDAGPDVLSYAANTASGKMVSEAFFREYILPYEKRLIEYIQNQGVHVLYHNCGYARKLFDCYVELGMHAYESLTPLPFGDTLLNEALEILGPHMVISGGLDQIEFLRTARPTDVRNKVMDMMSTVNGDTNFILAASDYLTEGTPHENILAFSEAGREFGRL